MDAATKTRTILIDGMTSEACVQQVLALLKRTSGITVESVKVGEAVVVCSYPAALGGARAALMYAGFRPHQLEYSWGGDRPPASPAS